MLNRDLLRRAYTTLNISQAHTLESSSSTHMVPPGYVIGQMAAPRVEEPEEPLYVNAKQYHRILKRRAARANLEAQNRQTQRGRKFMHESRHLHAMRRPRGPGGRFLTAAEIAALDTQGELNNSSKSNGSQSTGGSEDGANGSSSNSSHDKIPHTSSSSRNHNGHYFPPKTAAPSQPAHGFKAMPPADGQRVSYQA
ncbi:MAG: CCAAT-binding transcription factor (CBF-B/NF-YA) subunit B-domain-containing protein [Benniella sp.]|nr:MAG: CCAAT-binding transcription factor (CBF-B/NF-YA) subunit B-domain-containing protein [Benniella sp.]